MPISSSSEITSQGTPSIGTSIDSQAQSSWFQNLYSTFKSLFTRTISSNYDAGIFQRNKINFYGKSSGYVLSNTHHKWIIYSSLGYEDAKKHSNKVIDLVYQKFIISEGQNKGFLPDDFDKMDKETIVKIGDTIYKVNGCYNNFDELRHTLALDKAVENVFQKRYGTDFKANFKEISNAFNTTFPTVKKTNIVSLRGVDSQDCINTISQISSDNLNKEIYTLNTNDRQLAYITDDITKDNINHSMTLLSEPFFIDMTLTDKFNPFLDIEKGQFSFFLESTHPAIQNLTPEEKYKKIQIMLEELEQKSDNIQEMMQFIKQGAKYSSDCVDKICNLNNISDLNKILVIPLKDGTKLHIYKQYRLLRRDSTTNSNCNYPILGISKVSTNGQDIERILYNEVLNQLEKENHINAMALVDRIIPELHTKPTILSKEETKEMISQIEVFPHDETHSSFYNNISLPNGNLVHTF